VKLALQPKIRSRRSETAEHIAPEIALLPRRGCGKSRAVQDFAAGIDCFRSVEAKVVELLTR